MVEGETTLHQVDAKRSRAAEHASSLKNEIDRWELSHRDAVKAVAKYDKASEMYEFRVVNSPDMPRLRWGAMIGDVVQNLRSALDYLAWHAAIETSGAPPPDPWRVFFPITPTREIFDASRATRQFSDDYSRFFLSFQPFVPWPGPDRWVGDYEHPLLVLQRLSNDDKHKLITPILHRQGAIKPPKGIPLGAVAAGATNEPVQRDAVMFRVRQRIVEHGASLAARVTPFVALTNLEGVDHAIRRLIGAVDVVYEAAKTSDLFS